MLHYPYLSHVFFPLFRQRGSVAPLRAGATVDLPPPPTEVGEGGAETVFFFFNGFQWETMKTNMPCCIYIYVYIYYVYIYIYMYCVYIYICICLCICIHIYIYAIFVIGNVGGNPPRRTIISVFLNMEMLPTFFAVAIRIFFYSCLFCKH